MADFNIQGFLLKNIGSTYSLIITAFAVNCFLKVLQFALKKQTWIKKVEDQVVGLEFYLGKLWSVFSVLTFSTFIQMHSFQKPHFFEEYMNIFFFIFSLIFICVPFGLIYLIYIDKYPLITKYFSEQLNWKYYKLALYMRKFFYSLSIVAFQISPVTQLTLIFALHILFLILLVIKKPFISKFSNFKECIQTGMFLISYSLIAFLRLQDNKGQDFIIKFSWSIISSLFFVLLFELLVCVREIIIIFKEQIQKFKERKQLAKVQPKPQDENGDDQYIDENNEKQFTETKVLTKDCQKLTKNKQFDKITEKSKLQSIESKESNTLIKIAKSKKSPDYTKDPEVKEFNNNPLSCKASVEDLNLIRSSNTLNPQTLTIQKDKNSQNIIEIGSFQSGQLLQQ